MSVKIDALFRKCSPSLLSVKIKFIVEWNNVEFYSKLFCINEINYHVETKHEEVIIATDDAVESISFLEESLLESTKIDDTTIATFLKIDATSDAPSYLALTCSFAFSPSRDFSPEPFILAFRSLSFDERCRNNIFNVLPRMIVNRFDRNRSWTRFVDFNLSRNYIKSHCPSYK